MKLALAAILILLAIPFAFAQPPLPDICYIHTPTYIEAAVADRAADSAVLSVKLFTQGAGDNLCTADVGERHYFCEPGRPLSSDNGDDFHIYKGLKSPDVLIDGPANPELSVDQIASGNLAGGKAEISIPLDEKECFVTIIYWGHVAYLPDGVTIDEANSYSPTIKTMPVCEAGAPSAAAGVTDTTLCLPLVLLLGLLAGGMYVQGKNPLAAFDFSSPRVTGGRPYTMRKGGMINAFGYMMFNVGNYASSRQAPVLGGRGMNPLGMGGTGGGGGGAQRGFGAKDIGMGAGGTIGGAFSSVMGIFQAPGQMASAMAKPKLNASDFGTQAELQQAVAAGRMALLQTVAPGLGGMLGGLMSKSSAGVAQQAAQNQQTRANLDKMTQEQQSLQSKGGNMSESDIVRLGQLSASINQLNVGTQKARAIDASAYLGRINGKLEQAMERMNAPGANAAKIVEKFNSDTLAWRKQVANAAGFTPGSLALSVEVAKDAELMRRFVLTLSNAMNNEKKIQALPANSDAHQLAELTASRQSFINEMLMVQSVAKFNVKNPDSKISVAEMSDTLGSVKGAAPQEAAQLNQFYFGELGAQNTQSYAQATNAFLEKYGEAGAYYLLSLNAQYAVDVNRLAAQAGSDPLKVATTDAMLGAIGDRAAALGMLTVEMQRHADGKEASEYVAAQLRAAIPQTMEASTLAAQALRSSESPAYARQFQLSVSTEVNSLQQLTASARAQGLSIDQVAEDFTKIEQRSGNERAKMLLGFVQNYKDAGIGYLFHRSAQEESALLEQSVPLFNYVNDPSVAPGPDVNIGAARRHFKLGGDVSDKQAEEYVRFQGRMQDTYRGMSYLEQDLLARMGQGASAGRKGEAGTVKAVGDYEQLMAMKDKYARLSREVSTGAESVKHMDVLLGQLDGMQRELEHMFDSST